MRLPAGIALRRRGLVALALVGPLVGAPSPAPAQPELRALLRTLGAPRPYALWGGVRDGPSIAALEAQQRSGGAALLECTARLAPRAPEMSTLPVFVAFAPSGAVTWTSVDREHDPLVASTAVYGCIAAGLRRAMSVQAFGGDRPMIVLFPLRGTRW